MTRTLPVHALLAALLMLPAATSAETIKFKYYDTKTSDEKGVELKTPEGVACGGSSVIASDAGNGRLLRFSLADDGTLKGGTEIKVAQLSYPTRIKLNSRGEIFALDGSHRRIVRLDANGAFVGYLEPRDLPGRPEFAPRSLAIDGKDNIYLLDIRGERVLVLDQGGKFLRNLPYPKQYGFFSDVAVDGKGTVYLLDSLEARVYSATSDAAAFKPVTETLREYMNFPVALSVDAQGRLFILDQNGSAVITLGPDGSFLGRQLNLGWKSGFLYYPSEFCLSGSGEAIIADRGNNRLQIFKMIR